VAGKVSCNKTGCSAAPAPKFFGTEKLLPCYRIIIIIIITECTVNDIFVSECFVCVGTCGGEKCQTRAVHRSNDTAVTANSIPDWLIV